ncbi:MAG: exo-alpha-sialidase [Austwickia sp.]|nr:exo-alpha-sialidase [Austwickia sp.]
MNGPALRALSAGALVLAFGGLSACVATTAPDASGSRPAGTASSPPSEADESNAPIAITHIHAVARDPETGELLLATHEGLFRHVKGELSQNGPIIDLMGFAVGPNGTFYASGHPGIGVDLPQPVGLITSADGGLSWQVTSRGGESDFHALTVGPKGVTGFDGTLRTSTDGRSWTDRSIAAPPRALAASPTSGTLLATTAAGLLLSTDDAATWQKLTPPETAVLVAWADEQTIVTTTSAGRLATSDDAGTTWTLHPDTIGTADSLFAERTTDGKVEIIVVVDGKVLRTTDAGATTEVVVQ